MVISIATYFSSLWGRSATLLIFPETNWRIMPYLRMSAMQQYVVAFKADIQKLIQKPCNIIWLSSKPLNEALIIIKKCGTVPGSL